VGCPAPFSISFVGSRTSATSGRLLGQLSYWLAVRFLLYLVFFGMESDRVRVGRNGQRSMEGLQEVYGAPHSEWAFLGLPVWTSILPPTKFDCLRGAKLPLLFTFWFIYAVSKSISFSRIDANFIHFPNSLVFPFVWLGKVLLNQLQKRLKIRFRYINHIPNDMGGGKGVFCLGLLSLVEFFVYCWVQAKYEKINALAIFKKIIRNAF